jgi:hypothetical protein
MEAKRFGEEQVQPVEQEYALMGLTEEAEA